jgi:hypothetical protein
MTNLSPEQQKLLLEAFQTNYDLNSELSPLGLKAGVRLGEEGPTVTPLDPRFGEVKASEANLPQVIEQRQNFEQLLNLIKNK